jgi:uncharacterized protein DUF4154
LSRAFENLAVEGQALSAKMRLRKFRRWLQCLKLLAFTSLYLVPAFLQAQEGRPTDVQVEAVYLFNFGKFVRWPSNPDAQTNSFNICVLGKNPFGSVLDSTVRGETIDGRPVLARTVLTVQDPPNCPIVFISASEEGRLNTILPGLRRQAILTVSNIPHFTERGGMIEFVNVDDRIRFTVNVSPMKEAGLSVSSELLKVATKVIGQTGGPR